MHEQFETSGDESLPLTFAGFSIFNRYDAPIAINQAFYLRKVEEFMKDSSYSEFRSMRMRVAWLANTRPDLPFEISQLAQVTQKHFEDDAAATIKRLKNTNKYAHANTAAIRFPKFSYFNISA